MLTAHLAAGPAVLAPRTSGEAAVAAALRDALASFRSASGSYRIESEWRYVTAEA